MKKQRIFRSLFKPIAFGLLALLFASCKQNQSTESTEPTDEELMRGFKGTIATDIRDSKSDWDPFVPPKAPEGAPNVLFILYDDTGLGAWSPYGGGVSMPTMDALAADGLTFTNWHTTALCSPTRSTLLTGRTHWINGYANISEGSDGFPGKSARIPKQVTTIAEVLQDNGYTTLWLGKNHNVPEQMWHQVRIAGNGR